MLDIIKKDHFILTFTEMKNGVPGELKRTHVHAYTEYEKKLVNLDVYACAAIISALPYEIYHLVQNCLSGKEMMDTLTVAYEGTGEVRVLRRTT